MANNVFASNLRTRILQDTWDWWWNINNNICSHFRLFPGKTDDKIFRKKSKNPILGSFYALLSQIWTKCHLVKKSCQLLNIPIIQHREKIRKTNDTFLRKMPNWQTSRQTDNGDFDRTVSRTRVPKFKPESGTFRKLFFHTQNTRTWQYLPLLTGGNQRFLLVNLTIIS